MNYENEIWEKIVLQDCVFNDLYEISNYGRLKFLSRQKIRNNGVSVNFKEFISLGSLKNNGYMSVCLSVDGKQKYFLVHKLVAEYFLDKKNNKSQVNHIDGNKTNNFYKNLEWVTPKENSQHANDNKLVIRSGEKNGRAKLKLEDVLNIRNLYKNSYIKPKVIAEKYGVSVTTIKYIVSNKTWNNN